jgi:hypothetical protein
MLLSYKCFLTKVEDEKKASVTEASALACKTEHVYTAGGNS